MRASRFKLGPIHDGRQARHGIMGPLFVVLTVS